MLLMPAAAAFLGHAPPESESRFTIISTWTPPLIMPSQIVPNLALSPPAFWMSESMPASSNAFFRLGRSLASQRGDVVVSGRMTPTFLVAELEPPPPPPPPPPELSSLPHAEAVRANAPTATSAATRPPLLLTILRPPAKAWWRGDHHDVCCPPQHNGVTVTQQAPMADSFVVRWNQSGQREASGMTGADTDFS